MRVDKSKWKKGKLVEVCDKASSNIVISKENITQEGFSLYGASGEIGKLSYFHQDKEYIGLVKDGSGVGRVEIYPPQSSLVGTMQYLFPKNGCLLSYLRYLLVSLDLAKYTKGAAIPHIYYRDYKNEDVFIPSSSEQRAIAEELDGIQSMIGKCREQLEDYNRLARSIFHEMFGDPVRNEKGWEVKTIKDVCSLVTDGTHNPPKFQESGIPFIVISCIVDNEITLNTKKFISEKDYENLQKRAPIEMGDVLYTSVGSYGNPAIVKTTERFAFQRHIALLKPLHDIVSSIYLHSFLCSQGAKLQADNMAIGAAQKTLNLSAIRKIQIPLSLSSSSLPLALSLLRR